MTVLPSNVAGGLLFTPIRMWSGNTISYGFPGVVGSNTLSTFGYTEEPGAGYSSLSAAQQARFTAAIGLWDQLIAPNFQFVSDNSFVPHIRVAFTNYIDIKDLWGYAAPPPVQGGQAFVNSGDVWINNENVTATFTQGDFDFMGMLHEIGHALGLSHPHDNPAFQSAFDSTQFTLMSYQDNRGVVDWRFSQTSQGLVALPFEIFPETPMVLDIQAIQSMYGADPNTFSGNTNYAYVSGRILRTIYDANGNDTIDVSAVSRASIIDLRPGSYSSIGIWTIAEQIAHWSALFPGSAAFINSVLSNPANDVFTFEDNLGIAFNTIIENAIGGAAGDTITGNAAGNIIDGRAGNDIIFGGAGDDRLSGGLDNDILFGEAGDDTGVFNFIFAQGGVVPFGAGLFVGGEGLNFISDLEVLIFNDGTIDRRDADPTIDDLYYYGVYKDVWNAKADADAHYKNGGWREGRNPSQWFDTNAYLAAYADARDAAAQGMDPLTHYLTIGWKKNYDPSTLFDTSSYLAAYADVAASGINPLVHYMTLGIDENRLTFGDGSMVP